MKKIISLVLVALLAISNLGVLSFATATTAPYPNITFENSDDFTIVRDTSIPESIKAVGLTDTWAKVGFTAEEKDYLTWRTSNASVIKFNYWWIFNASTITGRDEVDLVTTGSGNATVTVTYNPPNGSPVSVSSYVVVESGQITSSVSSINTTIDGSSHPDYTNATSIPLFSLKEIYGSSFNDADVLKETPTALHALLYNLELQNDPDGTTSINDPNWDWDWVNQNVTITSEGSYVSAIGTDVNNYSNGWQIELNNVQTDHSSSVCDLSTNDNVKWYFGAFSW